MRSWITLYDAEAIDKAGYRDAFFATYYAYERAIFGHRVYTLYDDTDFTDPDFNDEYSGFIVDTWVVNDDDATTEWLEQ